MKKILFILPILFCLSAFSQQQVFMIVNGAPANQAPTASAGADQSISTSTVTLTGSGTDADGTIASYAWTKVSGTGGTITSATSASTTVTGLTTGSYVFRLTVTDNGGLTATDDVTVTVSIAGGGTPSTVRYEGENYDETSGGTVQAEADDASGYALGSMFSNRWAEYNYINAPSSGSYTLRLRVKNTYGSRTWSIQNETGGAIGTVVIPLLNVFGIVTTTISLSSGVQKIRFVADAIAGSPVLNWFEIDGLLPSPEKKTILINFSNQYVTPPNIWNKAGDAPGVVQAGTFTMQLKQKRTNTPYYLNQTSTWQGVGSGQSAATDGDGVFENSVIGSAWNFTSGNSLKVSANPSKVYTVYILTNSFSYEASTASFTVNGVTTAQKVATANIGSKASYPDWRNDPALIKVTGVTPVSGEITLVCNLISGSKGVLNALIIEEQ